MVATFVPVTKNNENGLEKRYISTFLGHNLGKILVILEHEYRFVAERPEHFSNLKTNNKVTKGHIGMARSQTEFIYKVANPHHSWQTVKPVVKCGLVYCSF